MLILFSFGSEMQRIFFWSSTLAIHASTRQASSKSHGAFVPSSLTRSTRNKQGQRRSPGPPAKDSRREICSYNEHLKEKPRRRWGRGEVFNGRFAQEGRVLDSEPSVENQDDTPKRKMGRAPLPNIVNETI